jgi:autocrine motility factor receptor
MPRVGINAFKSLPKLPLPSVKSYLTFSTFLFVSGFYYYYMVLKSSNISSPFSNSTDDESESVIADIQSSQSTPVTFSTLKEVVSKHPLLFYVLLNTLCAFLVFTGKALLEIFIGPTSAQEDEMLRNTYRMFIQCRFAYTVFLSHNNIFENFFTWLPSLIGFLIVTTFLDLIDFRLSSAQQNILTKTIRIKYLIAAGGCIVTSVIAFCYLFWLSNNLYFEFEILMLTDCLVAAIQAIYVFHKIVVSISRPSSDSFSHHMSIFYSLASDALDFFTSYHVYIYSRSWPTISCFVMLLQFRMLLVSLAETIRKHVRHQRIVKHINDSYPEASKEDLLRQDSCTICWETMEKARRLPCGHIFHELCLRRWLQQDSSCAVCRTALSLHLSQVLRDDNHVEEEFGAATIVGMELFRLLRWFQRANIGAELTPTQINAMVEQVITVFPQYSRQAVTHAVRLTGSVDLAVNFLLENGNNLPVQANNEVVEVNDTEAETEESETEEIPIPNAIEAALNAFNPPQIKENVNQNTWFGQQRKRIIEECRRKYLESKRASDLRASFSNAGGKKEL